MTEGDALAPRRLIGGLGSLIDSVDVTGPTCNAPPSFILLNVEMASTELISGVVGAIGGVSGAAVGALATLRAAARQQAHVENLDATRRREAARAQDERQLAVAREEARISARILQADVIEGSNRLQRALDWDRFWAPHFALSTDTWTEYRASVARHMEADGWAVVSIYFMLSSICERQAIGAREFVGGARPALTNYQRWQITSALDAGRRALEALEEFSGDAAQRVIDEAIRQRLTPPT